MRQIAEGARVLTVLLIAAAVLAVVSKFGLDSYTTYKTTIHQQEKDVRAETALEDKRRDDARLEEANTRKAQLEAQLAFTQEQNRLEEAKIKLVHEDLERMRKEIELKAQAEQTGKVFVELEKAAQVTLERESALKLSMPTRTFTLKDGTVIKATRWLESGPEWIVKNEAGNLVKVQKDQIEKGP